MGPESKHRIHLCLIYASDTVIYTVILVQLCLVTRGLRWNFLFLWSHAGAQVSHFGEFQILGFRIRDAQPLFSSSPRVHGFLLGSWFSVMGGLQGSKTLLKLCVKFPCAF